MRWSGYPPDKLHQVLLESKVAAGPSGKGKAKETDASWVSISSSEDAATGLPRVVYEIKADSDRLEPRLRLLVNSSEEKSSLLPLQSITTLDNVSNATVDSPDEASLQPVDDSPEARPSSSEAGTSHDPPSSETIPADASEQVIEISCVDVALLYALS